MVGLAGCGDTLADAEYRGEALYVIEGPVAFPEGLDFLQVARCEQRTHACYEDADLDCQDDSCFDACEVVWDDCIAKLNEEPVDTLDGVDLRLGLFWSRAGVQGAAADADDRVEQTARIEAGFPARYQLVLHTPPPDAVMKSTSTGRYAIGLVLVYVDGDHDGRFTRGRDQVAGGAVERAVLYTPDGVELGDRSWTAGYHRVITGQLCDEAADGGQVVHLATDPAATLQVELSAGPDFLAALLLDEDCDGVSDEYGDLCPPPEELDVFCDDSQDPGVCELCWDLLEREEEEEEGFDEDR